MSPALFTSRATWFFLALVLAVGADQARAGSLDGQDVVVLCSEELEGVSRPDCAMASLIGSFVLAEGGRLVDADQSARIRQSVQPQQVTSAAELKGVDFLDAEVAILASTSVEAQALPPQLKSLQGSMKGAFISVRVRVMNVANAAFVVDESASAPGMGLSLRQVLDKQLGTLWNDSLKPKVVRGLGAASQKRDIDLWVYDVPGTNEVSTITAELKRLGLAQTVSLKGAQRGLAKWHVGLAPGVDAAGLSAGLEGSRLFLVGQGLSSRLVSMAYAPREALRVDVKLDVRAGPQTPAWLATDLDGRVRATLLAKDGVRVVDNGGLVSLAFTTTATRAGVAATALLSDSDGKPLGTFNAPAATSRRAIEAGVDDVIGRSLTALFAAFSKDPKRYGDLRLLQSTPRVLTVTTDATTVGVAKIADGPAIVGVVTVSPKLDEQKVTVTIGDLASGDVDGTGALRLVATPAAKALTAPTTTTMTIEVQGRLGERPYRATEVVRVVLWPETSVDWTAPADVARLLEPQAPWRATLRERASAGSTASAPSAVSALSRAQRAWDQLSTWGVVHEPRDDGSVDVLQTPSETLARGAGDAGDLLALTASALLAVDVGVALAKSPDGATPPQLLVDTGLEPGRWMVVAADQRGVVEVGGRLFVPLDVTARGVGLGAAIARAQSGASAGPAVVLQLPASSSLAASRAPGGALAAADARIRRARVLVLDVKADVAADTADATAAARAVSVAMAGFAACDVASQEDLRRVLDLEAQKQLAGCNDGACLTELGDALGAQTVVYGSLARGSLVLKVWDIKAARVAGVVEVPRAQATLASALGAAVDALMVPVLKDAGLAVARAGRAPTDGLALPRDPTQRLRALLLRGEHQAAQQAAQALPAPRRPLALSALQIARGEHTAALTALKAIRSDGARKNELVSAVAQGDRALAARIASDVGEARARKLVEDDEAIATALTALLAGNSAPTPSAVDIADALSL